MRLLIELDPLPLVSDSGSLPLYTGLGAQRYFVRVGVGLAARDGRMPAASVVASTIFTNGGHGYATRTGRFVDVPVPSHPQALFDFITYPIEVDDAHAH